MQRPALTSPSQRSSNTRVFKELKPSSRNDDLSTEKTFNGKTPSVDQRVKSQNRKFERMAEGAQGENGGPLTVEDYSAHQ